MKKLTAALTITGAAAAVVGTTAFLIAPKRPEKGRTLPFYGRNFAHRGLHSPDKSVPENSLAAFKLAAESGYGIELDVRLSADDEVIVFHDNDLERICGTPGCIEILTLDEIRTLRILDTDQGIPTLKEVLDVMGSSGAVIVELKSGPRNRELCKKTLEIIRQSKTQVCVQSFDPRILRWFRWHAPEVLRGQITDSPKKLMKSSSFLGSLVLGNGLANFMSRPNYIAHGAGEKSFFISLCERMGAMKVAWTSHRPETAFKNDAVIFEYYKPRARYK